MDPATIVGIVAAAAQFTDMAYSSLKFISKAYNDVSQAPHQATELHREISLMLGVVTSTKATLETVLPSMISDSQILPINDTVLNSTELLQTLLKKMEDKAKQRKTGLHRLTWPFDIEEIKSAVNRLQQHRETLNLFSG